MPETISFPEPHDVVTQRPSLRKYLTYLLFFGPGAVLASMTIGQAQFIIGPQIGAWAGYRLLWLITLNVGSYVIAYISCRFTMLSGVSLMDIFALKTRRGWLNWLFIGIIFFFVPLFAAAVITTLGQTLAWIFSGPELLWGIGFCTLALLLVLVGRYRLLEYTQAFFVAVLGIGAVISVLVIQPDLLDILPHFFTFGDVPGYPAWVDQVKGFARTPIPVVMLGYLGTLTVTIIPLVGYLGWIKVKRWGIFKDRSDPDGFQERLFQRFKKTGFIDYLPDSDAERRKSRLLLRPILVDLAIAFIIVSVVSIAYMVAGAALFRPAHVIPTDQELLTNQKAIFVQIAPQAANVLTPLYQLSIVFALFGTVYAGFEAAARMIHETGRHVNVIGRLPYRRFLVYLMAYVLGGGILLSLLVYAGISVLLLLSLTLLFIGVVGVVVYGAGAIYMTQHMLPKRYRLGRWQLAVAIASVAMLLAPLVAFFA